MEIPQNLPIFAASKTKKTKTEMKTQSQNYSEEMFEGKDFVQECLDSFDEHISKLESEYADSNKSA